ncbi:MAG: hydroxymethylbilane synthase [Rhabdochlamydiaceae bacterium]
MQMIIPVAARASILSQIQVKEILSALKMHHPFVDFYPTWIKTWGDRDLKSSLKGKENTPFFTKEVDEALLKKECRIAIHSAKDLPYPLADGLEILALTKGVDPADVLVLKSPHLDLTSPLRIGTSSERRENMINQQYPNARLIDIRGTIQQRLALIEQGIVDAVVMAEAALIRLDLTHLPRLYLGPGDLLQGRLAVVGRLKDEEMKNLFVCLDARV